VLPAMNATPAGPSALILSIAVLAVFALTWGGGRLLVRGGDRTRAILMIVAALVLLGNVLIWTLPLS
jgi:hypothetical protein